MSALHTTIDRPRLSPSQAPRDRREIEPTPIDEAQFDEQFRTDHLLPDLTARSIRGGAATLSAQAAKFILRLGSTVLLARLLTPGDFGLIAMVTAITGFVAMFKDIGLSTATVQRRGISHAQVSTLFWINVALSSALMLAIAAAAPLIAWLYGEWRLVAVTIALAFTFLISGLTIQHRALLKRQMRFHVLAAVEVASLALGIGAGIGAALAGLGYWALVIMILSSVIADTTLLWLLCRWRPGLPRRRAGVRSMLAFGGNLTGSNILLYCSRNMDGVLLGATWGAGALGLYSRAYQLLLLPIQQFSRPIASIAIPALSRLQDRPQRFRGFYRNAMMLVAVFGMPITAAAFVSADEIVSVILGGQWLDAVPMFRALGPAAFMGSFNVCAGWAFIPCGRTDRQLRAVFISTSVVVLAAILALPMGPVAVAWAFSIATVATRLPHVAYAFHGTPLRLRDLAAALWRPATASLSAAAIMLIASPFDAFIATAAPRLAVELLVYFTLYLLILLVLPGGRAWFAELAAARRAFRSAPAADTE